MTLRRLLIAGGGGSFVVPIVRSLVSSLGISQAGAADTSTVTVGDTTFVVSVKDTGHIFVTSYNSSTHTSTTPFDLGTTTAIDGVIHNAPSIVVRASDQRLIVAFCNQFATQISQRISTNALDATAWDAATLGATGDGYYFGHLMQLTDGTLYNFPENGAHGATRYIPILKSTDGGVNWTLTVSQLIKPRTTTAIYWRTITDGTKIHILTTDTDRTAADAAVYHFYLESDVLYAGDGSALAGSAPYFANAGTLVQSTALGSAMPGGPAIDSSGQPAVVVQCYDSSVPQTLYRMARFNGSTWTTYAIDGSAGLVQSNHYNTLCSPVKNDPNVVWYPKKVGSYFEMFRARSGDGGATWVSTQITSGSTLDNLYPDTPVDAGPLEAVWGYGTVADSAWASFSFDLHGYGT